MCPMGEAGDDLLGKTLGAYRIEALLGEGATGRVYRGLAAGRRPVAVKVLAPEAAADASRVKRFFAEARAVSALGHPNIVAHTDFQEFGARSFVVMELLTGSTLRRALDEARRFTPERAVRIGQQIADALAAVHRQGIVHREVTPENVFLVQQDEEDDFAKVLGFGLAQLLPPPRAGEPVGTPTYMSPEVALGGTVTPASDVYALGVLLFELIAGRPPFVKDSVRDLLLAQARETPPRLDELCPEVPRALADALADALAKHPAKRPAGMNAFKHRLHAALGGGPVEVPRRSEDDTVPRLPPVAPWPPPTPAQALGGGRRGLTLALAGGALLLLVLVVVFAWPKSKPRSGAPPAAAPASIPVWPRPWSRAPIPWPRPPRPSTGASAGSPMATTRPPRPSTATPTGVMRRRSSTPTPTRAWPRSGSAPGWRWPTGPARWSAPTTTWRRWRPISRSSRASARTCPTMSAGRSKIRWPGCGSVSAIWSCRSCPAAARC